MALKHHPAIVYNSLEDAMWVRTKGRTLQDNEADRNLAEEVAGLMSQYRQEYSWQAVSVENICIPEIGMPFRMIQVGFEEDPCSLESMTYVNPVVIDYWMGQDMHAVFGACGSLPNPYFSYLRPNCITLFGIPREDYLKGDSMLATIFHSGNYYPDVCQHETEHTQGICLSDKGLVAHLYSPHGKHQPLGEKGHFPSEFGSFIYSIYRDTAIKKGDSPFSFALDTGRLRYKWEPSLEQYAELNAPAELNLVLDFEQGKPYYQLHQSGCVKIPSRLDYGKPFVFNLPNYPGIADILMTDYRGYQKTNPPEPFFRPEMRACACMDK